MEEQQLNENLIRKQDAGKPELPPGQAAEPPMRTYIGAKIIQATPMDEYTFLKEKGVDFETAIIPAINRPGYKVVYPDGYVSWSPQDVFEEAYRLVSDDERRLFMH